MHVEARLDRTPVTGSDPGMQELVQELAHQRILAIVREDSEEAAHAALQRLIVAGARVVEVSLTTPGALRLIEQHADTPGVLLGAGTVLTASQLADVAAAGVAFCLSPILDLDLLADAKRRCLAMMPAAATPTEAVAAQRGGAELVKLFPASLWKPSVLRDLRQALPDVRTVPTGGVRPEAAEEWWAAGAFAVGIGSSLTRMDDQGMRLLMQRAGSRARE